jgi:CAAX prenyl protease-like protein
VPFAIYIAFLALPPALQALDVEKVLAGVFDLRWMYAVQIGCVVIALTWFWRGYDELHAPLAPTRPLHWVLTAGCGAAVFALWIHLDHGWMVIGDAKGFDPTLAAGNLDWALVAVRLFGAAVVVPVMEELFWRSFVMRWIAAQDFCAVDPARVGIKAFAVTAIVFGLEHQLWLAGIVAGAAYGGLYVYCRNLWLPVAAHGVTNAALGTWVVIHHEWRFW